MLQQQQPQPSSQFIAISNLASASGSSQQQPTEFQPRHPTTSAGAAPASVTSAPFPRSFHQQISSPICQPSTGGLSVVPLTSSQSFNNNNNNNNNNKPSTSSSDNNNRASFLAPRPSNANRKPEELDAVAHELLSEFVLKTAENSVGLGTGAVGNSIQPIITSGATRLSPLSTSSSSDSGSAHSSGSSTDDGDDNDDPVTNGISNIDDIDEDTVNSGKQVSGNKSGTLIIRRDGGGGGGDNNGSNGSGSSSSNSSSKPETGFVPYNKSAVANVDACAAAAAVAGAGGLQASQASSVGVGSGVVAIGGGQAASNDETVVAQLRRTAANGGIVSFQNTSDIFR
jgi:hypothetical protein